LAKFTVIFISNYLQERIILRVNIFSDFSIDEILTALVDEENSLEFFELFLELVYSLK